MDELVLKEVRVFFENHEKDFWLDLPGHVKAVIERSQKQASAGLLTPHDEVMKKYVKTYEFTGGLDG